MIADSMLIGSWVTPRGNPATFAYRDFTNDWNVVTSCLTNDEYGLANLTLTGTALDVGAHIGAVSVALALDNPGLRVIAIEPVPENLELLRDNLERNGVADRVTVLEGAVGTESVTYDFGGDETATHNAWIGNAHGIDGATKRTITVPRWTLDETGPAGFVKIDCEGGEWGFLDDPNAASLPLIVGELHQRGDYFRDEFVEMLATHDVTFDGPVYGVCGFRAVRRA